MNRINCIEINQCHRTRMGNRAQETCTQNGCIEHDAYNGMQRTRYIQTMLNAYKKKDAQHKINGPK